MTKIDGIRELKNAMVLYFFSYVFLLISLFLFFISFSKPTLITSIAFIFAIISIIICILTLLKIHFGFKLLKKNNKSYNIGVIGAIIQIIGFIFASINYLFMIERSLVMTNVMLFIGFITLIGSITVLIGSILIGIALWRIGIEYKKNAIKVGAVFYIIFNIVGVLLLYSEFKKILKKNKKIYY